MKITKITAYPVEVPLTPFEKGGIAPYVTRDRSYSKSCRTLVKVETDEGIVGWGEWMTIYPPKVMKALIEEVQAPRLIGDDPFQIHKIIAKSLIGGYLNNEWFASGIEIACWDIIGKALGKPIYALLGGKVRDRVAISYCLGIMDLDSTIQRVQEVIEQGYETLKIKAGKDVLFDAERVNRIREVAGPKLKIRVDPNQGYTTPQALRFLKEVETANLEYIEQPIRVRSFGDLVSLRTRCKTPIAVNEDCYVSYGLLEVIKQNAADAAVFDLETAGGLTGLKRVGSLAEEANLPLAHHCGLDLGIKTAAIIHGVVSTPAFSYAMDSTYYSQAHILKEPLEILQGSFTVPEGPGLGIEVDERELNKYKV